eukprot:CAMPEP_0201552174 /NCGR_PEP_ID=MMETSP0173_2-20130828/14537_1 /ASSEMBLY_ACC=CAM_ASM_000268 /TAXON_ID=218659 /ORGANISM="Vexillifera sp., Strain DIVA3 564/2" /LENGTH=250 /DNA_ID=CAMNT_0047962611 /DNA_START=340 /DNA_END=1092 /DNA_ORIENTATION=-
MGREGIAPQSPPITNVAVASSSSNTVELLSITEQQHKFDFFVTNHFTIRSPQDHYWAIRAATKQPDKPAITWHLFDVHEQDHRQIPLSPGAQRCLYTPNAGGSSEWSEAMSFEILRSLYSARFKRTETEIEYAPGSKITDYAIDMMGLHLGVSVTRAMAWIGRFDLTEAVRLLNKKLYGIIRSSDGVVREHRWDKQILHVIAQEKYMVDILIDAYHNYVDKDLISNTIVIISTCQSTRTTKFMFSNIDLY